MMEMERRFEPKRMNIEKRVALFVPGKDIAYQGVSSDMSDAGLCADFQRLPKEGEDVILQVFWQEDRPPIEQPASVVWRMRSSADGSVRAGLKMRDLLAEQTISEQAHLAQARSEKARTEHAFFRKKERSKENKTAKSEQVATASIPFIELGSDIRLLKGGMAIDTKVASIGEINDDNTVQIVLEIRDPAFGSADFPAEQSTSRIFEQDCMNHPIRDTGRALKKFFLALYQRFSSNKSRQD